MKYRVETRYEDEGGQFSQWDTAVGKKTGPAVGLSKEEAQKRADSLRRWLRDDLVRVVEDQ
jgi:hypothetical protein